MQNEFFSLGGFRAAYFVGLMFSPVPAAPDRELMPGGFKLHRSDVFFEVLDVIPAEKAKSTRCNDISDYARELMLSYIEQRPEEENRYDYARTVQ